MTENAMIEYSTHPPQRGRLQFSLQRLLEFVAWASFAFAFIGFKINISGVAQDHRGFSRELFASSFIVAALMGAGVGCLWGSGWLGLVLGMLVGLSPIVLEIALEMLFL